jgi:hypothetical protein
MTPFNPSAIFGLIFTLMPPIEESEIMPFEERIQKGFEMALSQGLDMNIAMSSVAVAICISPIVALIIPILC